MIGGFVDVCLFFAFSSIWNLIFIVVGFSFVVCVSGGFVFDMFVGDGGILGDIDIGDDCNDVFDVDVDVVFIVGGRFAGDSRFAGEFASASFVFMMDLSDFGEWL